MTDTPNDENDDEKNPETGATMQPPERLREMVEQGEQTEDEDE